MTGIKSPHILLIEDNPGDAKLIQEMLQETFGEARVDHYTQLESLKSLPVAIYDVILLDLNLPDSNGLYTVLSTHELLPNIPIVVLTGLDNQEMSIAAIQSGAQDYLVKGKIKPPELFKTLNYAMARHKILTDINKNTDSQKIFFSTHDVLTGLPNQPLFLEHLNLKIEKCNITKSNFSLFFIDINGLEDLISNHGHLAKDEVIKKVAELLRNHFATSAVISRYNENTLAILLHNTPNMTIVSQVINDIKTTLTTNILIGDKEYFPSYNIGISIYPFSGLDANSLITNTLKALNKSTMKGAMEHEIYESEVPYYSESNPQIILQSDLQSAIEHQEFYMMYQPQVDLNLNAVSGMEALVRWHHPKFGIVMPEDFIGIAEENRLMQPIGLWILEKVIKQYALWQNDAPHLLPLEMSINISTQQLYNDNFIISLHNILKQYKIPTESLVLELTETIFIDETEPIIEKFTQLKKLGIQIAIDDFGKGYSSLSYLSRLPIDRLKLDMSFVKKNQVGSPTALIVRSIIALAHSLNLKVTAEGVETLEQVELLKDQQCDEVQGFYFSQPLAQEKVSSAVLEVTKDKLLNKQR